MQKQSFKTFRGEKVDFKTCCTVKNSENGDIIPVEVTVKKSDDSEEEGILVKSPRNITVKPYQEKTVPLDLWILPPEGYCVYAEATDELEDQGLTLGAPLFESSGGDVVVTLANFNVEGKKIKIKRGEGIAVLFMLKGGKKEFFEKCKKKDRDVSEGEFGDLMGTFKNMVLDGKFKK